MSQIYPSQPTSFNTRRLHYPNVMLIVILLMSAFLELFELDQEGYANTYYAAAVQSMLSSWHNFFFVSYDAAGFVALDKPPLGFWIQAASAKLLGFSGFSLLLPEALAGIGSVALLYLLVARVFGRSAGLCAALVLALTPISVVVARNNTIDSLLMLALLLAVYYVSRATETGKVSWLLWCAVCIGLGFNIKMLQAYLIVPACALVYLVGAPLHWRTRLWHLALAGGVLLMISLCWALAVDLTPATQRPFVSDSGTNSVFSLILGYNGLGRVIQLFAPGLQTMHLFGIAIDLTLAPGSAPYIGDPGPLRLFNQGIGNQISWFLPLAILGLCGASWQAYRHLPLKQAGVALLVWGGWLVTVAFYFSFARFFHLYYLTMLAPPLAALVGIGLVILWREYRRAGPLWWGLPLALVCNALGEGGIVQAIIALAIRVHSNPGWSQWITPVIAGGCLLVACALILLHCWSHERAQTARFLVIISLLVLLVAPFIWDALSLESGSGGIWLPQAGPTQPLSFVSVSAGPTLLSELSQEPATTENRLRTAHVAVVSARVPEQSMSGFQEGSSAALVISGAHWEVLDPKLIRYLQKQQGHATYLAATETSTYASVLMLATGKPVMALGGYQGWDRILTPTQLSHLVATGVIRFFYLSTSQVSAFSQHLGAFGTNGESNPNVDLDQWVRASCSSVASYLWQTTSASQSSYAPDGLLLYDCATYT